MSSLLRDSFLVTKLFRLSVYFVCCLSLLLVPQMFPLNVCFSSPLASDGFWEGIFCIRPFPLLFRLTYFQSMIFSLFFWCTTFLLLNVFFRGLLSVSSFHIHAKGWTMCSLQSVDFGVNSDISLGEDRLLLGECVFRQSFSFLYFYVALWYNYKVRLSVLFVDEDNACVSASKESLKLQEWQHHNQEPHNVSITVYAF